MAQTVLRSALGASALAAFVVISTMAAPAHAQRPTDFNTLFSFDETDVVEYWDDPTGAVRVHYSVAGPNVTVVDDNDGDGVPDYPQVVANTAAAVMDFYALDLGFRRPIPEAEFGLEARGGSPAFDVYLVDFGGNADGSYGVDECRDGPRRCVGYFSMENDFLGYNYPSLEYAANVLTSHELFHAIQAAYTYNLPVWISEGTAVWAENQWDPGSIDYLRFADAYLRDTGTSLYQPPGGPVPLFAYSTGLWFDFMSSRADPSIITNLMDSFHDAGEIDFMDNIEAALGGPDALTDEWKTFITWNLATGPSAGAIESYTYAGDLGGIIAEAQGSAIDHNNRFFPLATTYYRLDHAGGPIYFGMEEAEPELSFSLHPVEGGAADGPVQAAIATWTGDHSGAWAVTEDVPAGGYWMWASKAFRAQGSTRVRICLGNQAAATACGDLVDLDPPGVDDEGCSISTRPKDGSGLFFGLALMLGVLVIRRSKTAQHS